MSLNTPSIGASMNLNVNSLKKNTPMTTFDLNTYLAKTVLGNGDISAPINAELVNILATTAFNQMALNAMTAGNEGGTISKPNPSVINPGAMIQKAYGTSTAILDKAKAVAQEISTLYEGGQVTGNFDGQGLSVGYLQWNVGSGTLQPLLKDMSIKHPQEFNEIFGQNADTLRGVLGKGKSEQLEWAKSINNGDDKIMEPWKTAFNTLVKNEAFVQVENQHSKSYQSSATKIMNDIGVKTVRGYALAFDIAVQNGSVKPVAKALINDALAGGSNKLTNPNDPSLSDNQRAVIKDLDSRIKEVTDNNIKKLYYTAAAVAISSNDRFVKDVWSRKSAIVAGEGKVHGSEVAFNQKVELTDHAIV